MPKRKPKFPQLVKGSRISFKLNVAYPYIDGVLSSWEIVAAWAAAEWDDYSHNQYPAMKEYWKGQDMAIEWHAFRREHTGGAK